MRIAIDCNGLLSPFSGMTVYINNLLREFAREPGGHEYLLYAHSWSGRDAWSRLDLPSSPAFQRLFMTMPERPLSFIEHSMGIPVQELMLDRYRIDLFHGPANLLPHLGRCPGVVTNHGHLTPAELGRFSPRTSGAARYHGSLPAVALRRADRIITVSSWSRSNMVSDLGIGPGRIDVIHLGVDDLFHDHTADAQAAGRRPSGYILAIGPLNIKRNLITLAGAVHTAGMALGRELTVVIAGGAITTNEGYGRGLRQRIRELGMEGRVQFLPNQTPEEMRSLYRGASVLAYPSLLEGFGIPPLEAMACRCPVISSTVTSLPEICGDAALLVDPENEEALSGAIVRILSDPAVREDLIIKGEDRSRRFTWAETARLTRETYGRVLSGGRP